MKRSFFSLLLVVGVVGLVACDRPGNSASGSDKQVPAVDKVAPVRWYSDVQVESGAVLFQANCASCHQPDASGSANWSEPNAEGKYPPPPLNGSAHAWHHPLSVLRRTVRIGGIPLGGTMPGFAEKLNAEQIDDTLAWVQSHWSDRIYGIWHERNVQAGKLSERN